MKWHYANVDSMSSTESSKNLSANLKVWKWSIYAFIWTYLFYCESTFRPQNWPRQSSILLHKSANWQNLFSLTVVCMFISSGFNLGSVFSLILSDSASRHRSHGFHSAFQIDKEFFHVRFYTRWIWCDFHLNLKIPFNGWKYQKVSLNWLSLYLESCWEQFNQSFDHEKGRKIAFKNHFAKQTFYDVENLVYFFPATTGPK